MSSQNVEKIEDFTVDFSLFFFGLEYEFVISRFGGMLSTCSATCIYKIDNYLRFNTAAYGSGMLQRLLMSSLNG